MSVGMTLPERRLTNAEIASSIGRDEDWIEERTGIRERRIVAPHETAATLGTTAARRALDAVGLRGDDIDLIICATVTPVWRFPATACLIQSALNSKAAAFDLNAGCSGFLYGLAQADASVRSGVARRVLVVGSEVLSRITDYSDPKTAILFGDGAGAAVIEAADEGDEASLGPFVLFSDGSRPELLYVPNETGTIQMEGREVYRAAVVGMAESVARLLNETSTRTDEVDLVIAHQANARILEGVAARLGLPSDKMFSNIDRYGNTSSASIPIALAEAHQGEKLKNGDLVVITAFGAGFVWGACLARWTAGVSSAKALVGAVSAID
jgi:3-oxoacyl-[acyl-carrier-protein] synthase-3